MDFANAPVAVSPFWRPFLSEAVQAELKGIEKALGPDFTPAAGRVLRFLAMDRVRCVILGQDPYPQPGVATGRAFEVAGADSWADPRINSALKNMLKALHRTYTGRAEPAPIAEVRADSSFPVLPPDRLFAHWEAQGVLMLNTALTCRTGAPGSHAALWDPFTERVIRYIRAEAPAAAWLLWGKHAQQYLPQLAGARVVADVHPTARDGSFPRTACFAETGDLVDWYGIK